MRLSTPHNLPGTLICVEGIDGSGKSTQLALLRDWLKAKNLDVIFTEWNSSDLISQITKKAQKDKKYTKQRVKIISCGSNISRTFHIDECE